MKNVLKYASLAILAVAMLIALAGCGEDVIIARINKSETNLGNYEIKLEIKFEGDVISSIKTNMSFEEEGIINAVSEDAAKEMNLVKEGNTLSTELTVEEYKELYQTDFAKMSKDEIIEQLENEGFTIEK